MLTYLYLTLMSYIIRNLYNIKNNNTNILLQLGGLVE